MPIETRETTQEVNSRVFAMLDQGRTKEAADVLDDFTRTTMREDGFFRKILPPKQLTDDKIDRMPFTDLPCKVVDKEPGSPAAISIPFATMPQALQIRGPRYVVTLQRIASPRWAADVDKLRTYEMDIRQVLSDNAIKDMLAEEDGRWIEATNRALVSADTPVPGSGVAQWETMNSAITRAGILDALKVMNRTPSHLETTTILCNHVTIKDVLKWGRDEAGGNLSEDMLNKGWTSTRFMERDWIVTIKRNLVPDSVFMMYGDIKFLGRAYTLEDATMFIKKEAFMVDFFLYETLGATIGHTGAIARVDFQQ